MPTVNASSGWLSGNFWLKCITSSWRQQPCASTVHQHSEQCISTTALETALEAAAAPPLRPWPSIRANAQRRPH